MPPSVAAAPPELSLVRTAFVRWQAVLGALKAGVPRGARRPLREEPGPLREEPAPTAITPVNELETVEAPSAPLPRAPLSPAATTSSGQDDR